MLLHVQLLAGTVTTLTLQHVDPSSDTIADVKLKLEEQEGIPVKSLVYLFRGEPLEDDSLTLAACNIVADGSTITATLRGRQRNSSFASSRSNNSNLSANNSIDTNEVETASSSQLSNNNNNDNNNSNNNNTMNELHASREVDESNSNNSLPVQYLMGQPVDEDALKEALRAKAEKLGVNKFATYSFEVPSAKDPRILSPSQRSRLCDFLNYMYQRSTAPGETLHLVLPERAFLRLLDPLQQQTTKNESNDKAATYDAETAFQELQLLFHRVPGATGKAFLVLEQAQEAQPGLIDDGNDNEPAVEVVGFRIDGEHVTSTAQLALNDSPEYQGGRVVYFVNDELRVLEQRPAGSILQHPPRVLHGRTALTAGTCQTLWIVDEAIGARYHEVWMEDVNSFADTFRPQVDDCVVCKSQPASHVLVPCGHLCLCAHCVITVDEVCPKCRTGIVSKTRVFL